MYKLYIWKSVMDHHGPNTKGRLICIAMKKANLKLL